MDKIKRLFFGDNPVDHIVEFDENWTMANILNFLGINEDNIDGPIPRGLSVFKSKDGKFDNNVYILNL